MAKFFQDGVEGDKELSDESDEGEF